MDFCFNEDKKSCSTKEQRSLVRDLDLDLDLSTVVDQVFYFH